MELGTAVIRPVGRAGADLRPRHLKHGAHAYPHRAAAQRVAAGGGDEHGIHVQRGSAAEDSAYVGRIHDALQHSHPAGMGANLLHRAGRRTAEGAQHAPGQRKAGELCQQLPVSGIYRHIAAAGQNLLCRAGDLLALHQQGKGLVSGVQRPGDHLGAFGDKDALFRLQSVAQLRLREPSVDVQLRGGKVGDLMNDRHGKTPLK